MPTLPMPELQPAQKPLASVTGAPRRPPIVPVAEGRSGAPLVLLPGFLEGPTLWQALPARIWSGRECVAMPLPGHAPWQLSATALGSLLRGERAAIAYGQALRRRYGGQRVRLVGHSTGALLALQIALTVPDLVQDVLAVAPLFSGLVKSRSLEGRLMALPVLGLSAFRWRMERWRSDPARFRAGLEWAMAGPPAALPALEPLRQQIVASDLDALYAAGVWAGAQDVTSALVSLQHPVTAVICAADPVVDAGHQLDLTRSAPMVTAAVMQTGHLPFFEAPDAFERLVRGWIEIGASGVA